MHCTRGHRKSCTAGTLCVVALDGTCAAVVLVLLKENNVPLGGAAPLRVRVSVEDAPAVTVLGLKVSDMKAAVDTVMWWFSSLRTPR